MKSDQLELEEIILHLESALPFSSLLFPIIQTSTHHSYPCVTKTDPSQFSFHLFLPPPFPIPPSLPSSLCHLYDGESFGDTITANLPSS